MSDHWQIRPPRCGRTLDQLTLVLADSSIYERGAVEQLARYFKRELSNDFMQYLAESHDDDIEAWLFRSAARTAA